MLMSAGSVRIHLFVVAVLDNENEVFQLFLFRRRIPQVDALVSIDGHC